MQANPVVFIDFVRNLIYDGGMEAVADPTYLSFKLKQLRQAAGLTQEELARKVGVNRVSLARFESGARSPSWATVLDLADALGVTVEAFVEPRRRKRK
jgi:DNA-binding XRE family transcriptional regulator